MLLLKADCEMRARQLQEQELSSGNIPSTASEAGGQLPDLSEVAKKAKKSLADSFSGIMRRKVCDKNIKQAQGHQALTL